MFFFNDTATTEIYTLSLHDALPIFPMWIPHAAPSPPPQTVIPSPSLLSAGRKSAISMSISSAPTFSANAPIATAKWNSRSEEHTSELQSRQYLVCRLLLEKKKLIMS